MTRAEEQALLAEARKTDPFAAGVMDLGDGPFVYSANDVPSRTRCIAQFSVDQCQRAMALPALQKMVRKALERRMRQLDVDPHGAGMPPRHYPVPGCPQPDQGNAGE